MECCGDQGPADWQRSVYNNFRSLNTPEIGIPKSKGGSSVNLSGNFNVPKSCCKDPDSLECSGYIRNVDPSNINDQVIYTEVCYRQGMTTAKMYESNYLFRINESILFLGVFERNDRFCGGSCYIPDRSCGWSCSNTAYWNDLQYLFVLCSEKN